MGMKLGVNTPQGDDYKGKLILARSCSLQRPQGVDYLEMFCTTRLGRTLQRPSKAGRETFPGPMGGISLGKDWEYLLGGKPEQVLQSMLLRDKHFYEGLEYSRVLKTTQA